MTVKELLSSEDKWTKTYSSTTANGSPCIPEDRAAVRWCLVGAVRRCYGDNFDAFNRVIDKLHAAISQIYPGDPCYTCLADFNDNNSFAAVLAVVDAAGV